MQWEKEAWGTNPGTFQHVHIMAIHESIKASISFKLESLQGDPHSIAGMGGAWHFDATEALFFVSDFTDITG